MHARTLLLLIIGMMMAVFTARAQAQPGMFPAGGGGGSWLANGAYSYWFSPFSPVDSSGSGAFFYKNVGSQYVGWPGDYESVGIDANHFYIGNPEYLSWVSGANISHFPTYVGLTLVPYTTSNNRPSVNCLSYTGSDLYPISGYFLSNQEGATLRNGVVAYQGYRWGANRYGFTFNDGGHRVTSFPGKGVRFTNNTAEAIATTIPEATWDFRAGLRADTIIAPLRVVDTVDVMYGDSLAYRVTELQLPWASRTVGTNSQQRRGKIVFEVNITGGYTSSVTENFDLISDTANGVYMGFIKTYTRGGYSSGMYYGGESVSYIQRWSSGDLDWVTSTANSGTYVPAYNGAVRSDADRIGLLPEGYCPLVYYSTNSSGSAIITIEVEFYVAEAPGSVAIGDGSSSWWVKLDNI